MDLQKYSRVEDEYPDIILRKLENIPIIFDRVKFPHKLMIYHHHLQKIFGLRTVSYK